jgi:hypothetical protein
MNLNRQATIKEMRIAIAVYVLILSIYLLRHVY